MLIQTETGCNTINTDRVLLLREIQDLNFAIIEANLYLDAYENAQALEYKEKAVEELASKAESYEKKYGPLTMYGKTEEDQNAWIMTPWPWESEAN